MTGWLRFAATIAILLYAPFGAAAQTVVPLSVQAEGTEFVVLLADGRMLRSRDLVGATLVIALNGQGVRVRIDAVERDPDARNGPVWLHTLSAQTSDGTWQNLCGPSPDGLMEDAPPGIFELVCTSGGQGKCVRFGYLPWNTAHAIPLRDLYNACIRMVRADYCGNGTPTTKDGQQIDIYVDRGIQKPENAAGMDFEAGWTPEGATCVRHVRVKENVSLESLVAACPKLAGKVGLSCNEEAARASGARLFNRSRP